MMSVRFQLHSSNFVLSQFFFLILVLSLSPPSLLPNHSSTVILVNGEDSSSQQSQQQVGTDTASIQNYLATHDMESLHRALKMRFEQSERMVIGTGERVTAADSSVTSTEHRTMPLPQHFIQRGSGFDITARYKVEADLEQAIYLAERLPKGGTKQRLFLEKVIPVYKHVLQKFI